MQFYLVIRATHDSEYRKLKNETKKLLEVVGNVKKTAANSAIKHTLEVAKLTEEIATLRDAKNAPDRKARCKPDAKIDHITATAKAEIQKLVRFLSLDQSPENMAKKNLFPRPLSARGVEVKRSRNLQPQESVEGERRNPGKCVTFGPIHGARRKGRRKKEKKSFRFPFTSFMSTDNLAHPEETT